MNPLKNTALPIFPFVFFIGILCARSQGTTDPFLTSISFLEESKRQIKNDNPRFLNALNSLQTVADKALESGPYSVTYKEKAPPGGTKHDYFSFGPYWWPDSSKPDGLPYIRKDGQVNPERHSIKDASYHSALCRDIYMLGLAHYFVADPKYGRHAVELLKVWFLNPDTKMNAHLNFGQAIPGITSGRGIGLIDTHRLVYLIDGIQLLKKTGSMDDATYRGLQNWYREFLYWMLNSPIGKDEAIQHNNHGTYYDVQAVSMSLFTGQPELAKKVINEMSKDRIEKQLEPDGSQPHELKRTLSWSYSQMNLVGFFTLAILAENAGVDLWNYQTKTGKSIKNALTWMLPYAENKKEWRYNQIKSIDRTSYLKTVYVAARKYPDLELSDLWKANRTPDDPILLLTNSLF